MKKMTLGTHKVVMYDSIEELPIVRFQKYNKMLMLDAGLGSDVTDIIIKNKQQFAPVIKLQTAYDILRNADMNPDVVVSRFQSNISHSDVRYELDGSAATNKKGMGIELDKAYAALEVETQGMDKVCLGCNNRGIRFRTA